MNLSDDIVMRYLFGELSETERARLEAEYFADAGTFNRLERFESDLIDDYARGRLGDQTRARFERAYLSNPNRRARLKFGEALAARLDQTAPGSLAAVSRRSWWQKYSSWLKLETRALAFSMAVALLLLVFGSGWLFIQSRRLRVELAQRDAAQAMQEQRAAELQRQIADEQKRNEELTAELQRASSPQIPPTQSSPAAATPAFVTLLLAANGAKEPEIARPPTLTIPKGTKQVHVQLAVKDNDYPSYQIVLGAVAGPEIFKGQNLKPRISKSGAVFSLSFAASKLTTGDYMLTLRGVLQGGDFEDVSKSLFRVEKK
jgi:hypothetical protein